MSNPASRKSSGKGGKYKSPSERTPTRRFPLEKATSILKSLGSGAQKVVSQHPTMLCLGIMAATTAAKCMIIAGGHEIAKRPGTQEIHSQLGDLYQKAWVGVGIMAAVPAITAVAGAVGNIAGALTTKQ